MDGIMIIDLAGKIQLATLPYSDKLERLGALSATICQLGDEFSQHTQRGGAHTVEIAMLDADQQRHTVRIMPIGWLAVLAVIFNETRPATNLNEMLQDLTIRLLQIIAQNPDDDDIEY